MHSRPTIFFITFLWAICFHAFNAGADENVTNLNGVKKIGFSRVDITPPLGTPIRGHPVSLPSRGVESKLYATAMYLEDGKTEVVLVSCDVSSVPNDIARKIADKAETATGIPADNIIICTTHTHSGPSVGGPGVGGPIQVGKNYITKFNDGIISAIQDAKTNCKKGKLFIAEGELVGYAFNRRFIMSDGTIETHPLKKDPHIVKPEGPDSKRVFVWYLSNTAGEAIGVAVNFACHATVMKRDNVLTSSDYPGKMVEFISKKLGPNVTALFLQGTSGNICQVNPLDGSRVEVGVKWIKRLGEALGQRAIDIIQKNKTPGTGNLRVITRTIEIPFRTLDPVMMEWAHNKEDISFEQPKLSDYGSELYDQIESPYISLVKMFKTPYWANSYRNRLLSLEKTPISQRMRQLTIKVIAQDNWACVTLPGEFFIEWGNAICESSPFEHTSVVELANGSNGYIPTKKAYERQGGYETNFGTNLLVPETGDIVLNVVRKMLRTAYNMK